MPPTVKTAKKKQTARKSTGRKPAAVSLAAKQALIMARKKEIQENCDYLREVQFAKSLKLPIQFCPTGHLNCENNYTTAMGLQYKCFREVEGDGAVLWLGETGHPGITFKKTDRVGEIMSVDLQWEAGEGLRIHLIIEEESSDKVTTYMSVFNLGCIGAAWTVKKIAWDSWCLWSNTPVDGIEVDKRLLFHVLGDRTKIGKMTLEQFAQKGMAFIRTLAGAAKGGEVLDRPSPEEAKLVAKRVIKLDAEVITLRDSSSTSSEDEGTKRWKGGPKSPLERFSEGKRITRSRVQKMVTLDEEGAGPSGSKSAPVRRELFEQLKEKATKGEEERAQLRKTLCYAQTKVVELKAANEKQNEGIKQLLKDCINLTSPPPPTWKQAEEQVLKLLSGHHKESKESSEDEMNESRSLPDNWSPDVSGMYELSLEESGAEWRNISDEEEEKDGAVGVEAEPTKEEVERRANYERFLYGKELYGPETARNAYHSAYFGKDVKKEKVEMGEAYVDDVMGWMVKGEKRDEDEKKSSNSDSSDDSLLSLRSCPSLKSIKAGVVIKARLVDTSAEDVLNVNIKDEDEESEELGVEEESVDESEGEESDDEGEGMDQDGSYESKFGLGPIPDQDSVYVFLAKQGGEIFNVTSSEGSFRQHEGENDEEPGEVIDENEAAVFE